LLGEADVSAAAVGHDASGLDRQASVVLTGADRATARGELDWSFPGECKDVEVVMADGRRLYADLLEGGGEVKQSLWHQYVGLLADFARQVRALSENRAAGPAAGTTGATGGLGPDGVAALSMVADTYRSAREAREPVTVGGLAGEREL